MRQADVESPCIMKCVMDQDTGYCTGCLRTLKEISYWIGYPPEERRRIMALVEARREAQGRLHSGKLKSHWSNSACR